jgi:hypothetical protein
MNEILNFFERVTGDGHLGVSVFFTTVYGLYFAIKTWFGVRNSEQRNLNADETKKLLKNIGFLVANLAALILVVNIFKNINLSESMTQKLIIGSFLLFMMPVMLKIARKQDFVR